MLAGTSHYSTRRLRHSLSHIHHLINPSIHIVIASSTRNHNLSRIHSYIPTKDYTVVLNRSNTNGSALLGTLLNRSALTANNIHRHSSRNHRAAITHIVMTLPNSTNIVTSTPNLHDLPLINRRQNLTHTFPRVIRTSHTYQFNSYARARRPNYTIHRTRSTKRVSDLHLRAFRGLTSSVHIDTRVLSPSIRLWLVFPVATIFRLFKEQLFYYKGTSGRTIY